MHQYQDQCHIWIPLTKTSHSENMSLSIVSNEALCHLPWIIDCIALVFMLSAIFQLLERLFLRMKMSLVFSFGSSTFYYLHFFISFAIFVILFCGWGYVIQYRQGTYSPTLISWYVVTSMPITQSGFVMSFPYHWCCRSVLSGVWYGKPDCRFPYSHSCKYDHQPYLLCSNPDSCTVASHPPLEKYDDLVVSVDVKFVVKSTNEHPYHRTVYTYSKPDSHGLRDHLRGVPWLDIFKHDATYVAKEITEWVEIGIDGYIPHRKFQLNPHTSPWFTSCAVAISHRNHYFHQYHHNATPENKKQFYDSRNYCRKVLKDARANYALLYFSLSDHSLLQQQGEVYHTSSF